MLAHVATCARCRAEVEAATAARGALRALEAPPVPEGIGAAAIAEATREAASERADEVRPLGRDARAAQRWARVATGAGIAAVLLLGLAVVLPRIGGDASPAGGLTAEDSAFESASGAADPAATSGALEIVDADVDVEGVRLLAEEAKAAFGGASPPRDAFAEDSATHGSTTSRTAPATECLRLAFEALPGDATRLIQARYQGTPAYFGVFEDGPGAGQRPDAIRVLVASSDGCVPLNSTRVAL